MSNQNESEMMDEWRRTRYIKAAGPTDRSDPQPTLTDAERKALEKVLRLLREDYFAGRSYQSVELAAVIDGLLDRLG